MPIAPVQGYEKHERKALVTPPDEIWDIIDPDLGDAMRKGYSDTIRGIVLAWLSENGYLVKRGKSHAKESEVRTMEPWMPSSTS